jgi:hypothetical protein
MRAGLGGTVGPAIAPVEFGDQHQPAIVRGVEVAGEGEDFIGELVDGTHGTSL